MPAGELTEWMAYELIEPFGEKRADLRMGISTAAVLNRSRGKGQVAVKPQDLMPDFDKPFRPPQSTEEMKALVQRAIEYGG